MRLNRCDGKAVIILRMVRRFNLFTVALTSMLLATLILPSPVRADVSPAPKNADTAYDLINGVNA